MRSSREAFYFWLKLVGAAVVADSAAVAPVLHLQPRGHLMDFSAYGS